MEQLFRQNFYSSSDFGTHSLHHVQAGWFIYETIALRPTR